MNDNELNIGVEPTPITRNPLVEWWYNLYPLRARIHRKMLRLMGGVPADFNSSIVQYARRECELAWGSLDPESPNAMDSMQAMMVNDLLDIVALFASHGHSGGSAPYAINLLNTLLRGEPITPLTGADDEWMEVGMEYGGKTPLYQNTRLSTVFKEDDMAYTIDGYVFSDNGGDSYFTSRYSRKMIDSFPWTPTKTEYVNVTSVEVAPDDWQTTYPDHIVSSYNLHFGTQPSDIKDSDASS